jgi:hypothetical protein
MHGTIGRLLPGNEAVNTHPALTVTQFSVGEHRGKFIVEEESEVDLWRLNVWVEDFMCAVVHLYLECNNYSSCVKIHCQETDKENSAEE